MNKKSKGDQGEEIVAEHYKNLGYTLLERNYYKKGAGELDIIVENQNKLVFIEVKSVDGIDDLFDYISKKKISNIRRTIDQYLLESPNEKNYQIDVVFVKNNSLLEKYENITI